MKIIEYVWKKTLLEKDYLDRRIRLTSNDQNDLCELLTVANNRDVFLPSTKLSIVNEWILGNARIKFEFSSMNDREKKSKIELELQVSLVPKHFYKELDFQLDRHQHGILLDSKINFHILLKRF